MSVSALDTNPPTPLKVIDDKETALANIKKALPDDVKIKAADGEVWANRVLLSSSSEYFSAMLDEDKFQEGREGVGDLQEYRREVVTKVINYFYTGEVTCEDLSLNTILQLEELMRRILLIPQSLQVQEFTRMKISKKEFSVLECLEGLVTATELNLDIKKELYSFIINNLGKTCITIPSTTPLSLRTLILDGNPSPTPIERFNAVQTFLKDQDEKTKTRILSGLDMSVFTMEELLTVAKESPAVKKRLEIGFGSYIIFKDGIFRGSRFQSGLVFAPQHIRKMNSTLLGDSRCI